MTRNDSVGCDFVPWAETFSQRTNRSLAGARLVMTSSSTQPDRVFTAQQWGMTVEQPDAMHESTDDFRFDSSLPIEQIPDMRKTSGFEAMAYAEEHMPVLRDVMDGLHDRGIDFSGVRIAVCLILEPKTAILLRKLHAAGAIVGVYCGPDSTDPRVAEQLKSEGIIVESSRDWTPEQAQEAALRLLDTIQPNIIIDDGASFARLASLERPELAANLIGVAEETTSGVRAFAGMEAAGALTYPVVAVNDSILKTGFDNAHGTGETCVTTMQRILGTDAFSGARVTVIGYGPVGRGFARRVRALGARVTICDIDAVAALKAVFDGFEARDITDALPSADIVISATGVRHTITLEHMRLMREGTVLAVIGGIANEIALDEVTDFTPAVNRERFDLKVPEGPTLTLLADGDGVNYTVGGGNPIEIMDLSFAVQASAVAYLLEHQGALPHQLIRLGSETDRRIADAALKARGYQASHAVADNGYDWRLTRFAENARGNTATRPAQANTLTSKEDR
ncbi:adenosylhomocysteinase [Bifidobacterium scaligerum]|uniref:Adenosylhomocysteinase n=1 Tax=Bifidobacterium scaligerum TaxID=2052656 RepID=A0A2M9HRH6_9BIFI|nr:adenosylhomocysteinase [Bifidobacterium scaligerum]PJM79425.1 adenosylhomocysteinase [Bifidobacterium scaligerum]